MSSAEWNKVFAAVLLAGLIAMMSGFVSRILVHPEVPAQAAYKVDTGEAEPAAAQSDQPAAPEPIAPLLAAADAAAGQRGSRACAACHTFDKGGPSRVGPNLYDVVGRAHAGVAGFAYSDALKGKQAEPWDYEGLSAFLANPRAYAPGTKMNFAGIKSAQERANLIAWLRTLSDSPKPLP
ncbi:MAG TPA: cytochrome c family protein [Azospirillaceae bacterium]|nr:cytochrome c family protein [Azospirillaceae bacterium]